MATGLKVGGDVEQALENVGVPSYVLDKTGVVRWLNRGSRAARRRRPRSPLHLRRRARGQPARPRAVLPEVLGTAPATEATGVLVSTAGRRVAVEISAAPLMNGERVVGVFGLFEGRPTTRPQRHPRISPPARSRSPSSGAGPLDEADRRRAPSEHRDGQEPHPPSLQGPRRPLPTRSRRRRPGGITSLTDSTRPERVGAVESTA